MLVSLANTSTKIVTATKEEDRWLKKQLRFKDANEQKIVLYYDDHFPTGLVPLVLKQAAVDKISVDVQDNRGPMPEHEDPAVLAGEPFGLRDYQIEGIYRFLDGGLGLVPHPLTGRGILWVPTGGGKTYLTTALVSLIPGNWIFLVHRGHLADATKERWEALTGEPCGWIGDGLWQPRERFTVATLQTLYANIGTPRYQKLVDSVTGLVGDECHINAAATFSTVMGTMHNARLRLGLSGTPLDRTDRRSLIAVGCIGPVVYRVKASTLIEAKAIVMPTVNVIPCWQPPPKGETWNDVYEELVVASEHRNGAILKALELASQPGILFVRSVKHGAWLAKRARALGLRVEYVSGKSSLDQRKRACNRIARGDLDFIVSTTVFTEGVDIPALRSVILAAGGKSIITTLQSIGRGLRTSDGKDGVEVYDVGDNGAWLYGHAKARAKAAKREGYNVVVRRDIHPEYPPNLDK